MADAGQSPDDGKAERGVGPYTLARRRAIALARTGAPDNEVLAALRAEFSAGRPARIQALQLAKSFAQWVKAGDLEDARVQGRLAVLEALHDVATDPEAKDRVPAGVYLAKRLEPPTEAEIEKRLRELRKMTPKQLRAHAAKMAGGQ